MGSKTDPFPWHFTLEFLNETCKSFFWESFVQICAESPKTNIHIYRDFLYKSVTDDAQKSP